MPCKLEKALDVVGLGQKSVLKESRQVYYEQLKALTDKLITAWDTAYNPNGGSGDYEGQTALFS